MDCAYSFVSFQQRKVEGQSAVCGRRQEFIFTILGLKNQRGFQIAHSTVFKYREKHQFNGKRDLLGEL
jgi:hypothetical protein